MRGQDALAPRGPWLAVAPRSPRRRFPRRLPPRKRCFAKGALLLRRSPQYVLAVATGPLGARASCPRTRRKARLPKPSLNHCALRRMRGQDALAPRAPSLAVAVRSLRRRFLRRLPPRKRCFCGEARRASLRWRRAPWGRGHLALARAARRARLKPSLNQCALRRMRGQDALAPGPVRSREVQSRISASR